MTGEELFLLIKYKNMEIEEKTKAEDLMKSRCAFVPNKLEIDGRPELSIFPFNVLFHGFAIKDNKLWSAYALYEPELDSYKEEDGKQKMKFTNKYGADCWLEIIYDKKEQRYEGTKHIGNDLNGQAFGRNNWNLFFIHLTMLGLGEGEACMFEDFDDTPEQVKEAEMIIINCDQCGKEAAKINFYFGSDNAWHKPHIKLTGWLGEMMTANFGGKDLTDAVMGKIIDDFKNRQYKAIAQNDYNSFFGFICCGCNKCYCFDCYRDVETVMDGDFYDYATGTCPLGHNHEIND